MLNISLLEKESFTNVQKKKKIVYKKYCCSPRKYEDALDYHRQALVLHPQNPSTLSAMGYVHMLMGSCEHAVDYFHKVRRVVKE